MFDPVAYINEPRWRHSSLGLERVSLLMSKLGHPERGFRVVHVAGTNGKGSVCAYLSAMLVADGRTVGLFTSPYIERFEERIRVNGEDITPEELVRATMPVKEAACAVEAETGEHPTEFELMFAVACVHFAQVGCDVAVIEVGLGGRLDATNVVEPHLSVITRIGLDHTDILGSTLDLIAREKAGIVKRGVPVVSYPQEASALAVIRAQCALLTCPLTVSDFSCLHKGPLDVQAGQRRFSYRGRAYTTALLGSYQPENAAVAIDAARAFGIGNSAIQEGVGAAVWPGRFEVISRAPLVIVDGSHNPQGAEALAASLAELLEATHAPGGACAEGVTFVMGVLADKDYPRIMAPLVSFAKRFIAYAPDNPRALPAEALALEMRDQLRGTGVAVEVAASAEDALRRALQNEGPEGIIVSFGTLYAIGDIKRAYASFGVSRP